MKPQNLEYLKWINDNGNLDEKAPGKVKKDFKEWKKHHDEWKEKRFSDLSDEKTK